MEREIFDIFFREKPAMMLVNLKNGKDTTYASSLAKSVNCTYSHIVKILQKMQECGLIVFEKQGRLKLLRLTKKGRDIAEHIEAARNLLLQK